jgi:hypothetical protein
MKIIVTCVVRAIAAISLVIDEAAIALTQVKGKNEPIPDTQQEAATIKSDQSPK